MPSHHYDDDRTVIMSLSGSDGRKKNTAGPGLTQVASVNKRADHLEEMFLVGPKVSFQMHSTTIGLNPLVEAASPLLNEIAGLRFEKADYDPDTLRTRLETAVRSFEVKALALDLDRAQVLAARYLLCTALDESVSTSSIGESGNWSRHALLSTFHNETWGGEKFFLVLEKCLAQPTRSLYLLELMYIILSLGFEGRYRVMDRGNIALEALRDKVYQQIRFMRGDPLNELSPPLESPVPEKTPRYLPNWLVLGVAAFCLMGTYLAFNFILNQRAGEVAERFNSVAAQSLITASTSAPAAEERLEVENAGDLQ